MIKIEKAEIHGWEAAIRGMRNPLNSWARSDSFLGAEKAIYEDCENDSNDPCRRCQNTECVNVGEKDLTLMKKLSSSGTDHRKFMRMIVVYTDVIAPLYWWKEFDTYKVGTVANSCSTMHKIQEKEFVLDDFSHEHLIDPEGLLNDIITDLNTWREQYLKTKDKEYWWQMIQLLPSSYNQKRTLMLNYEVLANIYKSRKNHKLDEWRDFCAWIEELPYSELITGKI